MKRKTIKRAVLLLTLLLATACLAAVPALAQENGYWAERTDGEGRTVMVFTYTHPVEITVLDGADEQTCGLYETAEPIAVIEQAPQRLSPLPPRAAPAAAGADSGSLASLAVAGVLFLAALGFSLYKII